MRHPSNPQRHLTKSADIRALEAKAEKTLGVKMDITWDEGRDRGKMSLSFTKLEQLEDVLEKARDQLATRYFSAQTDTKKSLSGLCHIVRSARFYGQLGILKAVDRIEKPLG